MIATAGHNGRETWAQLRDSRTAANFVRVLQRCCRAPASFELPGWQGQSGSASVRAASPRDLLGAVTERAENPVALGAWRAAKEGLAKEGIDVFPDDLP